MGHFSLVYFCLPSLAVSTDYTLNPKRPFGPSLSPLYPNIHLLRMLSVGFDFIGSFISSSNYGLTFRSSSDSSLISVGLLDQVLTLV